METSYYRTGKNGIRCTSQHQPLPCSCPRFIAAVIQVLSTAWREWSSLLVSSSRSCSLLGFLNRLYHRSVLWTKAPCYHNVPILCAYSHDCILQLRYANQTKEALNWQINIRARTFRQVSTTNSCFINCWKTPAFHAVVALSFYLLATPRITSFWYARTNPLTSFNGFLAYSKLRHQTRSVFGFYSILASR